jgi:flavin reductase (DIM6/NTAB) family NADH-FMN oxidoreductase RutF
MQLLNREAVAKTLGRVVAGLYIVSLKHGDSEAGFLASWVQQAGFNPPMLSITFNKERKYHYDLMKESGKLVLNIMAKENGKTMSAFFKPPAEGKSVFEALEVFTAETGIPILKDSVGWLECRYHSEIASEDHIIVLAEIINGDLNHPEYQPSVHIRADGFKY